VPGAVYVLLPDPILAEPPYACDNFSKGLRRPARPLAPPTRRGSPGFPAPSRTPASRWSTPTLTGLRSTTASQAGSAMPRLAGAAA